MPVWTYEVNTTYNIPNITVYNTLCDGELNGFRVESNEGYVLYDTTASYTELDPDTFEEISVTYYYRNVDIPKTRPNRPYDFAAVLESSVDGNYIFGGVKPPSETI